MNKVLTMSRTTLANLALKLIHDHPGASDLELVRRWVACVQGDNDLLNACLQREGNRAIAMARDFLARERRAAKRRERQKELVSMMAKAAADQHDNLKHIIGNMKKLIVTK
jgi:hypothetical protein